MALRDLRLAFPRGYSFNGRYFKIDSEFPESSLTHGDLRVIESLLESEYAQVEKDILNELPLDTVSKIEHVSALSKGDFDSLNSDLSKFFYEKLRSEAISTPIQSTMGLEFPLANNLLLLDSRKHLSSSPALVDALQKEAQKLRLQEETELGYKVSGKKIKAEEDEDLEYQRHDPQCNSFVFQLDAFYVSGRKGTHPAPVLKIIRAPFQRTVLEDVLWRQHSSSSSSFPGLIKSFDQERKWLKEKTLKKEIPQYLIQVSSHARPLYILQSKFHPDLPMVSDPNVRDEYRFLWVGFKPLEIIFAPEIDDLYRIITEEREREREREREQGKQGGKDRKESKEKKELEYVFKPSEKFIKKATFESATAGRRIEKKLRFYFGVSPKWNRECLFDPKQKDIYIWNFPLDDRYEQLLGYSLPQQTVANMILSTANCSMFLKRESAKRQTTLSKTLEERWKTHMHKLAV